MDSGVWGSPRAGPPMEKEGGVRSARSGEIRMQPADNVIRRTPCLLPVVVSPFVGARHVRMLHISHMQRQRVQAQRGYVLLVPAPSQGLVEPAVRVCVYRHVVR